MIWESVGISYMDSDDYGDLVIFHIASMVRKQKSKWHDTATDW